MIEELLQIIKIQLTPHDFISRQGVRGPAKVFFDCNGSKHVLNGFGNEKIITPRKLEAVSKNENGQFFKTDLLQCLRHAFKNSNYNRGLEKKLIEGIKKVGGQISGSHYENSNRFWIDDEQIKTYVHIAEVFQGFTDFKAQDEDFNFNDVK